MKTKKKEQKSRYLASLFLRILFTAYEEIITNINIDITFNHYTILFRTNDPDPGLQCYF